jgi:hypothetical protein
MNRPFKKKISLLLVPLIIIALIFGALPVSAQEEPGTVPDGTEIVIEDEPIGPILAVASPTALQPVATETGLISLSIDGLGTTSAGTIQIDKPAGATVRKAYMAASDVWGSAGGPLPNGAVTLATVPVSWSQHVGPVPNHAWADVTSIVKPLVDAAPAGIFNIGVVESPNISLDGSILAVIFDDPNQTVTNTVILLFGKQSTTGDTFNIGLANPINLGDANLVLDLSLGISFGNQIDDDQYSQVDVNSQRLTSSAGGQDDGYHGNGGLITVGGVDDSNANPPDPNASPSPPWPGDPRYDDELYNLIPFVSNGDTSIQVDTLNPSNDDSIHFAALFLGSTIAVVGEGIVLGPATATNDVGTEHTVTATVQDDDGNPVDTEVTFTIVSGPHAGNPPEVVSTGADGQATYTYTGTSAGTDTIEASFIDSAGDLQTSNRVTKIWEGDDIEVGGDVYPVSQLAIWAPWIALAAVILAGGVTITVRRRRLQS